MRKIRLRPYTSLVEAVLKTCFDDAKVVYYAEGVYIVHFRYRKIAFTEEGRLIAVGTGHETPLPRIDALVSEEILTKADCVENVLRPTKLRC